MHALWHISSIENEKDWTDCQQVKDSIASMLELKVHVHA